MKSNISVWVTIIVLACGLVASFALAQDHIKINSSDIKELQSIKEDIAVMKTKQERVLADIQLILKLAREK